MATQDYPRKRYLPYTQEGEYPPEKKGYEMLFYNPDTKRLWMGWYEVNDYCRAMREKGYYAQAFASASMVRDAPSYYVFQKQRKSSTSPPTA